MRSGPYLLLVRLLMALSGVLLGVTITLGILRENARVDYARRHPPTRPAIARSSTPAPPNWPRETPAPPFDVVIY